MLPDHIYLVKAKLNRHHPALIVLAIAGYLLCLAALMVPLLYLSKFGGIALLFATGMLIVGAIVALFAYLWLLGKLGLLALPADDTLSLTSEGLRLDGLGTFQWEAMRELAGAEFTGYTLPRALTIGLPGYKSLSIATRKDDNGYYREAWSHLGAVVEHLYAHAPHLKPADLVNMSSRATENAIEINGFIYPIEKIERLDITEAIGMQREPRRLTDILAGFIVYWMLLSLAGALLHGLFSMDFDHPLTWTTVLAAITAVIHGIFGYRFKSKESLGYCYHFEFLPDQKWDKAPPPSPVLRHASARELARQITQVSTVPIRWEDYDWPD